MVSWMGAIRFIVTSLAASSGLPADMRVTSLPPTSQTCEGTAPVQENATGCIPVWNLSCLHTAVQLPGVLSGEHSCRRRLTPYRSSNLSTGHTLKDRSTGCHASIIHQNVNLPLDLEHNQKAPLAGAGSKIPLSAKGI